jgi:hypothetical protein
MKKEAPRGVMAKRPTKALREKRRWLGLLVEATYEERTGVEKLLVSLSEHLEKKPNLRLMDFWNAERVTSLDLSEASVNLQHIGGLAIVRADLKDTPALRRLLEGEDALALHGLMGLTTSGKIRLVRQRLGLPKPPRRR